ncbi:MULTISPECIES: hypothetical protein [Agrobacterium]|uniref:hypothetical protein n=1 Tax=Agrobacterium TaxID=357 RepID=UPI002300F6A8|nr:MULTISPECIES: hypothetical protein [Agrobacterium]MDA5627762.1 hypothetical protein [Agrobacterium sp. ST15.16.055]MDA6978490.1 hypothetical protein [Agrobacterium salinitolerans]
MQRIYYYIAIALAVTCIGAFILSPAFAQDAAPVIAPSSFWYELWLIVQPIAVMFVATVGPVMVTWIGARLIALLKITDEKQRVEIEVQLRTALHQSALNALKFAAARMGVPVTLTGASGQLVTMAADYVREKNPEALSKLGVDQKALEEIILSKIPDLVRVAK